MTTPRSTMNDRWRCSHRRQTCGDGRTAEATTDAEGRFFFAGVDDGRYALAASVPGFVPVSQTIQFAQLADWTRIVTLQVDAIKETLAVKAKRGSGAVAPASGPIRVRVGGHIKPPRRTHDVSPVYPDAARDAGYEGTVSIDAVIARDGAVIASRVTSPDVHPALATAAPGAVRQWRFSPTLLNRNPIEVVMTVSVAFTLE
ncbi:MAG: TonB family protein [Acidobacteria bacterium]|nr:TonB family protein [Acidobacteriota bacterium]